MIDVISTKEKTRLTAKLKRIRERGVALDAGLMNQVAAIAEDVRTRGDGALVDYSRQFDNYYLDVADIRVDEIALRKAAAQADSNVLAALREAIKRVRTFHEHEREYSWIADGPNGTSLGQRVMPIERVGVYVPGGTASYPSSVVMNIVPAQIAGVDRIVVATPPRALQENPAVAAALIELNVTEVFAVGGAQAIAALAYGTETVPRVDKIIGPGNRYVTAAKKLVYGTVGIASSVLITTSQELALEVLGELATQMRQLPRFVVIENSLTNYGVIIVTENLEEACDLINEIAPEHLEIMARDEESIASRIRNAGAIFFGAQTPEAVGDYLAGPNHVLPTSGTARFSSALSVRDFVKRTNTVRFTAAELKRTAPTIAALARSEGLEAHARSVLIRQEGD